MRYVLLLLLATVVGYGALQIGRLDPDNYVKMYIGNYVIEIKVLGFILLLIAVVLILYFTIRLIRLLWKAPKRYNKWRDAYDNKKADEELGTGYLSLIKGDWKRAERVLLSKSQHSSLPYLNYLAAAQAAQEQGKLKQRDEYLAAAYKEAPNERLAIGLTKARLHQSAGEMGKALATLHDVADIGNKNAQHTAMLMQTYQQTGDWQGAEALLPTARKLSALSAAELQQIYNRIHTSRLESAADKKVAWKALPRDQRKNPDNILVYARALIEGGDSGDAEKVIRAALKSTWSDDLVRLYGTIVTDKPAKLRRQVEGWLMARKENPELYLAAGRLAIAEKNLELAKEYLQSAIHLGQLPKAYSLLGEVFEATNESGKALQLYRSGMLSLSATTELDKLAVDSQQAGDNDESSA